MAEMKFPFTLSADPGTDLWKKPPSTDSNNAPSRPHSIAPLLHFLSAQTTFSLPLTTQYDQAGLVLALSHGPTAARKWIKAGVEFYDGAPRLSVVCCDRWADWSVAPMAEDVLSKVQEGSGSVTVRVEKQDMGLWVYYVDGKGNKLPLREVAWVYGDQGGEGWELEVAAMVARPDKEVKGQLEATFHGLEAEWEKH